MCPNEEHRWRVQQKLDELLREQKIYKYEFVGDVPCIWPVKHAAHVTMSCAVKNEFSDDMLLEVGV